MSEKTYIVSHAHARSPLTITGKSLKDALKKEGLNPDLWKEQIPPVIAKAFDNGEDKGATRSEDN